MHPTRIFKDPIEIDNAWEAYKDNLKVEANQWLKVQYVGKDGERVAEPQKVPYTFEGFKRFCRKNHGEVEQYFTNQGDLYTDFVGICRAIKEEIRENQIIGGLLGFHNPSITQRLNSLVEKTEDVTPIQPKHLLIKINRKDEDI
jgi:hypothetical protein